MKTIVLSAVIIFTLGFMLLVVEADSPMVCEECIPDECKWNVCHCGIFKDDCGCCNLCRRCPGDPCIWPDDFCQKGYVCGHPSGMSYVERYETPGKCVPDPNSL